MRRRRKHRGTRRGALSGLIWKSSKPNIAQVRVSGIAYGKKNGSATITASASGVKGTTTLTVGSGTLSSIVITPANSTVALGSTQQFTATGHFSDGSTQDITITTHFSSSIASVANRDDCRWLHSQPRIALRSRHLHFGVPMSEKRVSNAGSIHKTLGLMAVRR